MKHRFLPKQAFIPVFLLILASCAATFKPEVVANTRMLASRTDQLLAKAGEPFPSHATEVSTLRIDLQAAGAEAAAAKHNKHAERNWAIMNDPEKALAFGVMRRWEAETTLHAPYIASRRADIAEAFRLMVCLEENKQAPKSCKKPDAAGGASQ